MKFILTFFTGLLCFTHMAAAQDLVTYPVPQAVLYSMHNDDYTVKVRRPGGEWQDLYEYKVKVDMDKVQEASMVSFDFAGKVEVFVRKNNGDITSLRIRPLAAGVAPSIKGNTVTFMLSRPANLSVEFNGDKLHNLHVFANPPEKTRPDSGQAGVVWFGPGLHTFPDSMKGMYRVPSNTTVYIAGGAVVRGGFLCRHVKNVHIVGRGIVDRPTEGVAIEHSRHVEVGGIIFIDPHHYTISGGASRYLHIHQIKSFSCRGWSDGIDLMSCSDVKIDSVFLRTSDDCIAIYGHRWGFYGNARDYSISHSSLWADIAHPINIGLHGDTRGEGDTIENILFDHINILEEDEDDPNYEGCMAITDGDANLVRNVRFQNIRVDDFQEGKLINLRVVFNKKYNTGPGRGIEDVYFNNVVYNGINNSLSVVRGYDANHRIKHVVFRNLQVNGRQILHADSGKIRIGQFVRDIEFEK